jgi:hypothetical protein
MQYREHCDCTRVLALEGAKTDMKAVRMDQKRNSIQWCGCGSETLHQSMLENKGEESCPLDIKNASKRFIRCSIVLLA